MNVSGVNVMTSDFEWIIARLSERRRTSDVRLRAKDELLWFLIVDDGSETSRAWPTLILSSIVLSLLVSEKNSMNLMARVYHVISSKLFIIYYLFILFFSFSFFFRICYFLMIFLIHFLSFDKRSLNSRLVTWYFS